MKKNNSGIPEKSGGLPPLESRILEFVLESWPASALNVAEHFHTDLSTFEARKRASAKFSYYLQKLVDKQLLLSKRMGNALVVWPLEVEKYRAVHAILTSEQHLLPSSPPLYNNNGMVEELTVKAAGFRGVV